MSDIPEAVHSIWRTLSESLDAPITFFKIADNKYRFAVCGSSGQRIVEFEVFYFVGARCWRASGFEVPPSLSATVTQCVDKVGVAEPANG